MLHDHEATLGLIKSSYLLQPHSDTSMAEIATDYRASTAG